MGKSSAKLDKPSKADGKFEKTLEFYSKIRDTVASLTATKSITKKKKLRSRQKKLKAYDLSALSDFLPELKEKKQPNPATPNLKVNCKNMTKIMVEEARRMNEVHKILAFQNNPLVFVHDQLKSIYPEEQKLKKRTNKDGKKKKNKKKKKSKMSNASGASHAMEVSHSEVNAYLPE